MFRRTNPWQKLLDAFTLSNAHLASSVTPGVGLDGGSDKDEALSSTVAARFLDKIGKNEISITAAGNLVELKGSVGTPQCKARAERIACDSSGVEKVRNRLIVRAPKAEHPSCMQKKS